MKRAVASTMASRLYAEYSWEILTSIAKNIEENAHPLFNERKVYPGQQGGDVKNKVLLILITSNRGLCGAYNAQVIKKTIQLFKKDSNVDVVAVGRKGDVAMRRLGVNVIASFSESNSKITLSEILPISKLAIDEYNAVHYDKVLVAYTDFVSALTQRANIKQIIPISKTKIDELIRTLDVGDSDVQRPSEKINYLIEGDMNTLIGSLAEKITRMQIYQMLLESNASEQSSRMVAMKNASDASGEMIDDLTLVFNKARQSNITREISEISAGMASVS